MPQYVTINPARFNPDAYKVVNGSVRGIRPRRPYLVQVECVEFDNVLGVGSWSLYHTPSQGLPILIEEDDYFEFERKSRRVLRSLSSDEFEHAMTYMSNFGVINIDLRDHSMYPVIPRPKDDIEEVL